MTVAQLWKRGIPLSEAWFQFSSDNLYRKYNFPKLSRTIGPASGSGMLLKAFAEHPKRADFEKTLIRMQHQTEFWQHRSEVRREMEFEVLEQLQSRQLNAPPVEIPERFLEMKFIKWGSDTISAPPHEFSAVRIIGEDLINAAASPVRKTRELKKRGRPSSEKHIIEAMAAIAMENISQLRLPHKRLVPLIRRQIHQSHPGEYGIDQPADRTIMRIIPAGREKITKPKRPNI